MRLVAAGGFVLMLLFVLAGSLSLLGCAGIEVTKYVCPYCQEEFSKFAELRAHVTAEHPRIEAGGKVALINMQVSGAENLKPMMDELERRGIVATVWLSGQEIVDNCDYVRELSTNGHEIAGKYLDEIEPETSYEDQKAKIEAIEEAALQCTGRRVVGFRASRFTANEHTYRLLDEFGMEYIVRSITKEQILAYNFRPYLFPGYGFYVVPMPKAYTPVLDKFQTACDTASQGKLTTDEFQQMLFAAIDHHIRLGEPLVLEWHPSLTNPDDTEGWWDAFIAVLNYLETKGNKIEYTTTRDMIYHYVPC